MNRQSSPVIVRDGVHDVNLHISFHGHVLLVYRFLLAWSRCFARELEVVDGFGGFPRVVVVFPCFCVPFFLDLPNAGKSRRRVSRCICGYVGSILSKCLNANFLTDFVHSIDLAKPAGIPI